MGKFKGLMVGVLRSPWVWGTITTLVFYGLIHQYGVGGEFALRYFAGHWVLYVTQAMFFLGMSVLTLKAIDVHLQRKGLKAISLGEKPAGGEPIENCPTLLEKVAALPQQASYAVRRLRDALDHVVRTQSGDQLEDELKFLSDADAGRQHAGYAFVRLIITATPLMGFLGTVIGITMSIAEISPQQLIESPKSVTSGLSVAFDTTALAIALSLVLLVAQYLCDRFESLLLSEVDEKVTHEVGGRFAEPTPESADPQVRVVRSLAESVLVSTESLVERVMASSEALVAKQAELWKESMDAAQTRWVATIEAIEEQLGRTLAQALSDSLMAHADRLAQAEDAGHERQMMLVRETSAALTKSVEANRAQQLEIARQGDILLQVVEATGQVTRLEETLNRNLQALSGSAHFSETMVSLSAALHLLTARLGADAERSSIHIKRTAVEGKAA